MGIFIEGLFGKKKEEPVQVECPACRHVQQSLKSGFTCVKCGMEGNAIIPCPICRTTYIRYAMCCNKCIPALGDHIDGKETVHLINELLDVNSIRIHAMQLTRENEQEFNKYFRDFFVSTTKIKMRIIQTAGLYKDVDVDDYA